MTSAKLSAWKWHGNDDNEATAMAIFIAHENVIVTVNVVMFKNCGSGYGN